jgi:purine-nucleoside phosphorylase
VSNVSYTHIEAAAAAARDRLGVAAGEAAAPVGVVLGSGLGPLADEVLAEGGSAIEYEAIPHFPRSSVEGHKGRLVRGTLDGVPALFMQGRVHGYEGYTAAEVAFPIRVLKALGVKRLLLTNAAGGCGEGMVPGTLMLISDHLNLTGANPLTGHNDDRLGPRFPDMSSTYTPALRAMAKEVAKSLDVALAEGVYAGLNGPTYETPAEIRMLQTLGAHAVGMSTVFEAIAAAHGGVDVVGISCITNLAAGIGTEPLSHDEVKETAARVHDAFSRLVRAIIPRLGA